nr:K(+)-transporting ATPase subunit F [Deltaproteobacteria bacterium]
MDLVYPGLAALFFALTWGFVRLCERSEMSLLIGLGAALALLLLGYLLFALLFPERLS